MIDISDPQAPTVEGEYREPENDPSTCDGWNPPQTSYSAHNPTLTPHIAFALAMVGLLLVPSTIMRSLAAGAIVVALVSVIAALTLLPALLSLLGDRVNALRIPFFGPPPIARRVVSGRGRCER